MWAVFFGRSRRSGCLQAGADLCRSCSQQLIPGFADGPVPGGEADDLDYFRNLRVLTNARSLSQVKRFVGVACQGACRAIRRPPKPITASGIGSAVAFIDEEEMSEGSR